MQVCQIVHKRTRKAGRNLLAHDRRNGQAVRSRLQGRDKGRRHARDQETAGIDERFSALATYIRAGNLFECAWKPPKYGHFKGVEDKAAALALAAWARKQNFNIMFELRRVRNLDVLYVLLKAR
jgi:hypothetical protein